jgi:hypothetical protein
MLNWRVTTAPGGGRAVRLGLVRDHSLSGYDPSFDGDDPTGPYGSDFTELLPPALRPRHVVCTLYV